MSELEQRLREQPDDTATWLVYGDWLLQRGDSRGALVQLEHRRVTARDKAPLDKEIAALVKEHEARWRGVLPPGVEAVGWRHGFITAISVTWNDDAPALVARVLALPELWLLRTLRLAAPAGDGSSYDDEGDVPLVDCTRFAELSLAGLAGLELPYVRIGPAGAEALSTVAHLEALETLDLRYAAIEDAGIAAIAPRLRDVRRLHLQRNGIGAAGVAALATASLHQLVELDLRYNELGADGAESLARAPFLNKLARLELYRDDVSAPGVQVLARSNLPSPLRAYWRGL